MNKKLIEALEHCKQAGLTRVVYAIPFPISLKDALELKEDPSCMGMVLYHPSSELTTTSANQWLGCFTQSGDWRLPRAKEPLVFVGSQFMLTRTMAMRALRSWRLSIICKINGNYRPLRLHRFLLWQIGHKLQHHIKGLPRDSVLRTTLYRIAAMPLINGIWTRIFKRVGVSSVSRVGGSGSAGEQLYLELFRSAIDRPAVEKIEPVPTRVLLLNEGLAAGGAERQIVNTLIGLRDSGRCESVTLLAEYIDHAPHLDFFLHQLESHDIEVAQVQRAITLADDGLSYLPPSIAELVADLPGGILEEILNLVEEFRARRPSVVHAWQDSTSIKAGIAAVIAGVPRILLASRSVAPMNFSYYQDYMYPAYRALASLDCVTFLNNSEAGAADYTRWLGLPRERFAVVRNGVNLNYLKRADDSAVREYRQSLGIPPDAQVVGSVFRFWAEKRPMLWLQTAARLANRFPEVHFLIIGEGPMRHDMESFINSNGLKDRVHLPGTRPAVATPLSAMNVFLLTSKFEGTPNVILEAQWLGLPIVATDAGGTRESFDCNVTGLLAANPAAEELASLIGEYLTNATAMTLAKTRGPEFVAQDFGITKMIQRTIDLYGFDLKKAMHVAPA